MSASVVCEGKLALGGLVLVALVAPRPQDLCEELSGEERPLDFSDAGQELRGVPAEEGLAPRVVHRRSAHHLRYEALAPRGKFLYSGCSALFCEGALLEREEKSHNGDSERSTARFSPSSRSSPDLSVYPT